MKIMVNWLLVGTGDIAKKRVASALKETAGSHLYAVCDLDKDRAKEIASMYSVENIYTDYEEALEDNRIDSVYVATPVSLHVPMVVKALKTGHHVLVEKPLGLTGSEAQEAAEAETASSLASGCAYFRRFYPGYRMLKKMIEKGEFGKIVLVRMAFFSWFNPTPEDPKYWRVVRSKSGGGPISDMGTHMFDVLIGLLGLPESVMAMTETLDRNWDVEDASAIVMRMPGGALVTASFHWNSKTWVHLFEVVGTEAKVLWLPYDSGKVVKTVGREITELDMPPASNVHLPLIEDFISAVQDGRKPAVTFAEAAKTNRLVDAIYQASMEKREVPV